ncbi:hypothetical protein HPP92_001708 [Vanilla planifolia]|uniref:Presenilin n=1 Tax=Vanilla planifolia TaxID=51239 RepID=A0A835VFL2_VANPL|nr:hypothetical protein HPP92_001708 [Vanilla planifolia]
MDRSILDSLGLEIVGVMSPVSICMLLVVLLVSGLSPPSSTLDSSSPTPVTAATLVYLESPSDSTAQKLAGALLNAAVFVALVTVVTFLIVVLYYYNCTGFLKGYMRFSAFFVLTSMGGSILLSLLRRFSIPLDAPSAILLLLNFSVVGVLSLFSPAVPILIRQSYMVVLAIIVAAWFTKLPEWTTWTLLLALAAYDLVAVLCPVALSASLLISPPLETKTSRPRIRGPSHVASVELQPQPPLNANPTPNIDPYTYSIRNHGSSSSNQGEHSVVEIENLAEESSPLVSADTRNQPGSNRPESSSSLEQDETLESTRGIRLGLGDFIFYSVLVGRAAMYDLMTVDYKASMEEGETIDMIWSIKLVP